MAKRFTDSDIWGDSWFRKLPCQYKELWRFLCEKCDIAGVWKVDLEQANFFIGEDLDRAEALNHFNKDKQRVVEFKPGYWLLVEFVSFQYGQLSSACNPHKAIIQKINFYQIQGLVKGYLTLMDKDKEKDKEKGGCKGETNMPFFDLFWAAYPSRNGKKLEKKGAFEAFKKIPIVDHNLVVKAATHYANSGQIPKDAKRFLKDDYWREWLEPAKTDAPKTASSSATTRTIDKKTCPDCGQQVPDFQYRYHTENCPKRRINA